MADGGGARLILRAASQDTTREGQAAAQLLVCAIEGIEAPRSAGVDVALVVRESTATAPRP